MNTLLIMAKRRLMSLLWIKMWIMIIWILQHLRKDNIFSLHFGVTKRRVLPCFDYNMLFLFGLNRFLKQLRLYLLFLINVKNLLLISFVIIVLIMIFWGSNIWLLKYVCATVWRFGAKSKFVELLCSQFHQHLTSSF